MEKTIEIPEGVTAEKQGDLIAVKGPKGSLQRELKGSGIEVEVQNKTVRISSGSERRKTKALAGTFHSHIRNMIIGVTKGFEASLKVVYSHFPIKVNVEGRRVIIQNFLGERSSRWVEVPDGVKVDVKKDEIIVSGIDKEGVGLAAGRIEKAAKVSGFDRRVFQDGIHLFSKARPAGQG